MLIDWFTVGAQALNFVVLVWLMKRFLYGPILKVVEARDERVAAELADAKKKQLEAGQERDTFQHKNEDFDQERDGLMKKAKEAADAEGQRLLAAARQAAEAASNKLQQALHNEAKGLKGAIAGRAQQEVFAIARKALADLASVSLEAHVGEAFVRRVRGLDDAAKAGLDKALHAATEQALVRTAFDLPSEQREAIQKALNETFSMAVPLRFETSPDLVSGVELTANGQKVAWSIAEYLRSLQESVDQVIGKQSAPVTKAAPAMEAAAHHGD
ncbi:MAG: F0F1 ATP synthase subunit delta [Planctomycetota bacterium]